MGTRQKTPTWFHLTLLFLRVYVGFLDILAPQQELALSYAKTIIKVIPGSFFLYPPPAMFTPIYMLSEPNSHFKLRMQTNSSHIEE